MLVQKAYFIRLKRKDYDVLNSVDFIVRVLVVAMYLISKSDFCNHLIISLPPSNVLIRFSWCMNVLAQNQQVQHKILFCRYCQLMEIIDVPHYIAIQGNCYLFKISGSNCNFLTDNRKHVNNLLLIIVKQTFNYL